MDVLTIRIVKSFEYRNIRLVVLHGLDLSSLDVNGLEKLVQTQIETQAKLRPFRGTAFDTFKIHHKPHGAKTGDLAVSLGEDEKLVLKRDGTSLEAQGVEHETEITYYRLEDYKVFAENPTVKF